MQILVAILVVLSLWPADAFQDTSGISAGWSSFLVLACCGFVLLFAWIFAREIPRRASDDPEAKNRYAQFLFRIHTGIWILGCVLICIVAKWGTLVRHDWNLANSFLIDEILIVAPVLLPLLGSWFLFGWLDEKKAPETSRFQSALHYCGLRSQIYMGLTLIPMFVLWVANDVAYLVSPGETSGVQWAILFFAFLASTICFPWILVFVWPNEKLADSTLRKRISEIAEEKNIRVADIRIWKTGNQVTNAMVAGFFWPFRMVWLSDRMLQLLNADELDTVLRHEIGHAKRQHLPIRLLILLVPLIASAILFFVFPERLGHWAERLESIGISQSWLCWVLLPSLGIVYLVWALSWVSHVIEKDADIEACLATEAAHANSSRAASLDAERTQSFKSALLKISSQMPGGIHKQTLLHPSIIDRAMFLTNLAGNPEQLAAFRTQFRTRLLALVGIAAALFFGIISI